MIEVKKRTSQITYKEEWIIRRPNDTSWAKVRIHNDEGQHKKNSAIQIKFDRSLSHQPNYDHLKKKTLSVHQVAASRLDPVGARKLAEALLEAADEAERVFGLNDK